MNSPLPVLRNQQARRLFLARHGLGSPPSGPGRGQDLLDVIEALGFVQIDSINTVARAHHMILRARRQSYREPHLPPLLERDRTLFEHWTHDASMIPTRFFPYWRLKFERDAKLLQQRWKNWRRDGFEEKFGAVLRQISDHGPCSSSDVGENEARSSGGWWDWHPSKTALEYLWRSGHLSVTRREGFRKVYDLTENVIPPEYLNTRSSEEEVTDWACNAALDRLGFATPGEVAAFWDILRPPEARAWCEAACASGHILPLEAEGADGSRRRCFARHDLLEAARTCPAPSERIRILSPFDPALRDRKRAERLFGFSYRIEIFVPEPKRRYGYYVFPVLEGDRLIGRIDMKCRRAETCLKVRAFWPEVHIAMGKGRVQRLTTELERMARFAGASDIAFEKDWLRESHPDPR